MKVCNFKSFLFAVVSRHLYINGNELQRGGATELLQPLAEHAAQTAMTQQQTTNPTGT